MMRRSLFHSPFEFLSPAEPVAPCQLNVKLVPGAVHKKRFHFGSS